MSIATLNPWQVLDQLNNDKQRRYNTRRWQPVVDITESATGYEIHLELPGVKPEQVQVELDDTLLKISGEKVRNRLLTWRGNAVSTTMPPAIMPLSAMVPRRWVSIWLQNFN